MQKSDTILDMTAVNTIYCGILGENEEKLDQRNLNYKKHLKDLIQENILEIAFVKYSQRNKSEQIMSSST